MFSKMFLLSNVPPLRSSFPWTYFKMSLKTLVGCVECLLWFSGYSLPLPTSRLHVLRIYCAYRKCIVQKWISCLIVYVSIIDYEDKSISWSCNSCWHSNITSSLLCTIASLNFFTQISPFPRVQILTHIQFLSIRSE